MIQSSTFLALSIVCGLAAACVYSSAKYGRVELDWTFFVPAGLSAGLFVIWAATVIMRWS